MTNEGGRPSWHPTAAHGWSSDPNGVFLRGGRWHVFFQHNPASPRWGLMHWGHLVSDDLVHWRHEGIALTPTPGSPDADGCWSGCIRDVDGEPVVFYTGATGTGSAHAQVVMRSAGNDALTGFRPDPGLVVAPDPAAVGTSHQRDPFLLRDDEEWTMLMGTGLPGRGGAVVAWRSTDTKEWTYAGEIFSVERGSRDVDTGPVWECPQLIRLGEDWLLIVSVQLPGRPDPLCPYALWFIGDFDGTRFVERAYGLVDSGEVLYAPALAIAPDGRALMWAWLQESARTRSTPARTWSGAMSLPREVSIAAGRLSIRPASELEDMWTGDVVRLAGLEVAGDELRLPAPTAPEFRVIVESLHGPLDIVLGTDGDGNRVRVPLRPDTDGWRIGVELVSEDGVVGLGETRGDALGRVEVVVDHSILEVFCEGASVTARIDPGLAADLAVASPDVSGSVVDLVVASASGVRLDTRGLRSQD